MHIHDIKLQKSNYFFHYGISEIDLAGVQHKILTGIPNLAVSREIRLSSGKKESTLTTLTRFNASFGNPNTNPVKVLGLTCSWLNGFNDKKSSSKC